MESRAACLIRVLQTKLTQHFLFSSKIQSLWPNGVSRIDMSYLSYYFYRRYCFDKTNHRGYNFDKMNHRNYFYGSSAVLPVNVSEQ